MTATIATSAAILKTLYADGVPELLLKNNNALIKIGKDTSFPGANFAVAVQTETTQGGSAVFANAQAAVLPSAYSRFLVTRIQDYSVAMVSGEAMEAASGDAGAMVSLWKNEMRSAMLGATRQAAIMLYRSGGGGRGYGVGTVSTASLTCGLAAAGGDGAIDDVNNFAVGMPVAAAATDGGALRNSASTKEIILNINRTTGVLTSTSVAWNTLLTNIVTGDSLCRWGDGANASTSVVLTGFRGWCPGGSSPAAIFGLTRTSDPVSLAGQAYAASGVALDEALTHAIGLSQTQGGSPDTVFMHPKEKANLMKVLEARARYPRSTTITIGKLNFQAVEFESDMGGVQVISDVNCPRNEAWVLDFSAWKLKSIGKAPKIFKGDDNEFLRVYNADSYEVRIGMYGNVICNAPRHQVRVTSYGA